jgi:hypothetical protein
LASFKPTERGDKDLKSINDIVYIDGTLQFSIAIDLSNIPVDASYLTTKTNYIVPDGFIVKSVEKIDRNKIKPRDFVEYRENIRNPFDYRLHNK